MPILKKKSKEISYLDRTKILDSLRTHSKGAIDLIAGKFLFFSIWKKSMQREKKTGLRWASE